MLPLLGRSVLVIAQHRAVRGFYCFELIRCGGGRGSEFAGLHGGDGSDHPRLDAVPPNLIQHNPPTSQPSEPLTQQLPIHPQMDHQVRPRPRKLQPQVLALAAHLVVEIGGQSRSRVGERTRGSSCLKDKPGVHGKRSCGREPPPTHIDHPCSPRPGSFPRAPPSFRLRCSRRAPLSAGRGAGRRL